MARTLVGGVPTQKPCATKSEHDYGFDLTAFAATP